MKMFLRVLLILFAVAFIGAQAIRPVRDNPPVNESQTIFATGNVPPDVKAIIDRSCNDCHTNTVRWPWYSMIAPMSWLVAEDVEEGREELNFSTWAAYPPKRQDHKLEEICEQIEKGEMPLKNYLYLHPGAKLSGADRQRLCQWTKEFRMTLVSALR